MPSVAPTFTHRAIAALAQPEVALVQYVITQNEDGLHRRSGLHPKLLSEIHGCAFIELCGKYVDGDSDSDVCSSSDESTGDSSASSSGESISGSSNSGSSNSGSADPDEPEPAAGSSSRASSAGPSGQTGDRLKSAACDRAGLNAPEVAAAKKAAKRAAQAALRRAAEKALKEEISAAKTRRPPGCGAAVTRDFVTYYPDTYLRSNPAGRHVTQRACPHCRPRGTVPSASAAEGKARVGESTGGGEVGEGQSEGGEAVKAVETAGGLAGTGWLHDSTVDFGETPGGFPWGANGVHGVDAAKAHMQRADLVVAWGSTLSVLANYFDPWCPSSKWAKLEPHGLRKAASADGNKKRSRSARPCRLAIVGKGKVLDEELAILKIEEDVDVVARGLLRCLGLPEPPQYDPERDGILLDAMPPLPGEPAAPWRIPQQIPQAKGPALSCRPL